MHAGFGPNCDAEHRGKVLFTIQTFRGLGTFLDLRSIVYNPSAIHLMNNQSMEADFSSYHVGNDQAEPNAEQILEGSVSKDQSLEQVREILFGAEKRRSEHERRALDQKLRERIETLEADYERRFEKLAQELQQRFEKSCALLEAETAARREALLVQHEDLIAQLSTTAKLLGQAKTDRDELAGLLEGVAERLRTAAVA
jgi:hypothetical protein